MSFWYNVSCVDEALVPFPEIFWLVVDKHAKVHDYMEIQMGLCIGI